MSITRQAPKGIEAVRASIASMKRDGVDPTGYRHGLASAYGVDLEIVERLIADAADTPTPTYSAETRAQMVLHRQRQMSRRDRRAYDHEED